MLALGLNSLEELDELLSQPVSEEAALDSETPDEEYRLADRMYQEADRQADAQKRFEALRGSRYPN